VEYYARVAGVRRKVLVGLEVIFVFECRWDLLPNADEHAMYLTFLSGGDSSRCSAVTLGRSFNHFDEDPLDDGSVASSTA
jgi:hypothetical protein